MKISLIIPAYNEEAYIGDCLDSVIKNAGNALHEIIVIDNASTDKTREIAEKKGVKVIRENKKGVTRARQRGLKEASGDIIAYIDADTKMPKGWINQVQKVFAHQADVVCLSGPYKYWDGSPWQKIIMNSLWWISAKCIYPFVGYMLLGGNFAVKKQALLSIGGFDTDIEFYGDDTDTAKRLHKEGKVLFRTDFFIYTSCRRLVAEGMIQANTKYALNFIWPVFFHRPFTENYQDIRLNKNIKN